MSRTIDLTTEQETIECSICLDPPKTISGLDICIHRFCFNCILKWSKISNTCPMCQAHFTTINKLGKASKKRKRENTDSVQVTPVDRRRPFPLFTGSIYRFSVSRRTWQSTYMRQDDMNFVVFRSRYDQPNTVPLRFSVIRRRVRSRTSTYRIDDSQSNYRVRSLRSRDIVIPPRRQD